MDKKTWTFKNSAGLLRDMDKGFKLKDNGYRFEWDTLTGTARKIVFMLSDHLDTKNGKTPVANVEERLGDMIEDQSAYHEVLADWMTAIGLMKDQNDPEFAEGLESYKNGQMGIEAC